MSRTRVLLVGAAGETGGSIANGLLENPTFVRIPLFYSISLGLKFQSFFLLSSVFSLILCDLRPIRLTCLLTNPPPQELYALVRPRSVQKPAILSLQDRGVQIRKCDLKGSEETLANALAGIDVVISCVGPAEQQDQIPLAKAAKKAGVKRFVPCGFITVAPPGGIMWLRDEVRLPTPHT